ncbi:unnamed protein product [Rhizophagus irregularis]|uniref:Uncharacterized protein n=1 Tax=Rhizophagus irregularis TaxID=588596 RepID=A0A916E9B7_9GLOM|nr:unnamed protein product [Rhizophagus irregularis]
MQSSPSKRIMDARKDLKAYRNNGEKAQEIYDKFILPYRINGQLTPMTIRMNGAYYVIANAWDALCVMNELGESKIEKNDPQEVIRLRGISNWAFETDRPDIDLGTNRDIIPTTLNVSWKLITSQKKSSHLLNNYREDKRPDHNAARKWKERKEEKISAGGPSFTISGTVVGSVGREEADSHISAGDRSPPFPFQVQQISVWELLRDKHLVSSSKNETRDHNQNPYDQHFTWNSNGSLSKLPEISNQLLDLLRHGIHKITSEISLK